MSIPSLLAIVVGVIVLGGGLVMLARVVRPWRGGDQVLLVFLALVISVLGLVIGWLGITLRVESTETATPQPTVSLPTAVPPQPTSTAPPPARPTVQPPQVTPIPTLVVTAPRPTTPPPPATATLSPVQALIEEARRAEERAVEATNPADQLRHLRGAKAIAQSLLASNPCEYSLQQLFIRICRKLSLLDPAAAACANAPTCTSG